MSSESEATLEATLEARGPGPLTTEEDSEVTATTDTIFTQRRVKTAKQRAAEDNPNLARGQNNTEEPDSLSSLSSLIGHTQRRVSRLETPRTIINEYLRVAETDKANIKRARLAAKKRKGSPPSSSPESGKKRPVGRPRLTPKETTPEMVKEKRPIGRPRLTPKDTPETGVKGKRPVGRPKGKKRPVGRPRKTPETAQVKKRPVGRPRKTPKEIPVYMSSQESPFRDGQAIYGESYQERGQVISQEVGEPFVPLYAKDQDPDRNTAAFDSGSHDVMEAEYIPESYGANFITNVSLDVTTIEVITQNELNDSLDSSEAVTHRSNVVQETAVNMGGGIRAHIQDDAAAGGYDTENIYAGNSHRPITAETGERSLFDTLRHSFSAVGAENNIQVDIPHEEDRNIFSVLRSISPHQDVLHQPLVAPLSVTEEETNKETEDLEEKSKIPENDNVDKKEYEVNENRGEKPVSDQDIVHDKLSNEEIVLSDDENRDKELANDQDKGINEETIENVIDNRGIEMDNGQGKLDDVRDKEKDEEMVQGGNENRDKELANDPSQLDYQGQDKENDEEIVQGDKENREDELAIEHGKLDDQNKENDLEMLQGDNGQDQLDDVRVKEKAEEMVQSDNENRDEELAKDQIDDQDKENDKEMAQGDNNESREEELAIEQDKAIDEETVQRNVDHDIGEEMVQRDENRDEEVSKDQDKAIDEETVQRNVDHNIGEEMVQRDENRDEEVSKDQDKAIDEETVQGNVDQDIGEEMVQSDENRDEEVSKDQDRAIDEETIQGNVDQDIGEEMVLSDENRDEELMNGQGKLDDKDKENVEEMTQGGDDQDKDINEEIIHADANRGEEELIDDQDMDIDEEIVQDNDENRDKEFLNDQSRPDDQDDENDEKYIDEEIVQDENENRDYELENDQDKDVDEEMVQGNDENRDEEPLSDQEQDIDEEMEQADSEIRDKELLHDQEEDRDDEKMVQENDEISEKEEGEGNVRADPIKSPPKKKKPTRRKKTTPDRLPSSLTKSIFAHFTQKRVSKEALVAVEEGCDRFFEQVSTKLASYAKKDKRKTLTKSDVERLMKKQGFINDKQSMESLIECHLPLEHREQLIPMATAGNRVVP